MIVKTGYGYFKDSKDRIVGKYNLPPGEHSLKVGYTAHEVADDLALEKIVVYVPPKTAEQIREEKIRNEMRQLAINSLIDKGEIEA